MNHIFRFYSSGGHCWSSNSDSWWTKGGARIVWDKWFRNRNSYTIQNLLNFSSIKLFLWKIQDDHMVFSPSSYKLISASEKFLCHNLSIFKSLLCIIHKSWSLSFLESYTNSSDSIHMGSSLHSRKHRTINPHRKIFDRWFRFFKWISYFSPAKDQSSSWSTKWFMSRGHHSMKTIIERIFEDSSSNKSRNMWNICISNSSNFIRNFYKSCVVELSWIGAKPCQNNFWSKFQG